MTVQRAIGALSPDFAWRGRLALTPLRIAGPATAQTAVTTADIQRLQDEVTQASTDVSG